MGDVGEYPKGWEFSGDMPRRLNAALNTPQRPRGLYEVMYSRVKWPDKELAKFTAGGYPRFDTESGVKFQFSGHVTSRDDEPAIGPAFRSLMASIRDKVTSRITSPDDATECEIPYMDLLSLVAEQEREIAALKAQVLALTPKQEPVRNPMANALRFGVTKTGLRGL